MSDTQHNEANKTFSALLQLESDARSSADLLSLHYLIVNETRRLLHYRHAFLFKTVGQRNSHFQEIRASGVTLVDRSIPKIHWMERVINDLKEKNMGDQPVRVSAEQLPEALQQDWRNMSLTYPVWTPLKLPDGFLIGALWLERETAWSENELLLIKRLADTYAHAWGYFDKHRRFKSWLLSRNTTWALGMLFVLLLFLPVQNTTLGPVKVIAKDPLMISAPMDGVITSILVEPNQMVTQGQTLFSYEDTNYRNEYTVAEQSLAVAQAELKRAAQGAFQSSKDNAETALLKAKMDLAVIKRNYAKEMLDRVNVIAEKDGLLLFNDKSELIGRPVTTGERLMEIAETGKLMLRIDLPVENNIDFQPGAPVKIYLDVDPLHSIAAKVTYTSFRAEIAPGDILVYRVEAELTEAAENLRIGWQGTAKIYGDSVSLFFYLFRRPLSAIRQYLGY
ncbi:HlyD family efflux transporter periplasmic adaptor subunit [Nitrosomonas sp.]|uniref:efflux RND transporter periplasmic adaptor subunit n=1 Tax=Nitrosomonas sp. TaxID=42353 RepID=UPI00260EBC08|nr:HlyD family efflux transporter periplasmic adaptor subunit [Nitrosomonas sp.]